MKRGQEAGGGRGRLGAVAGGVVGLGGGGRRRPHGAFGDLLICLALVCFFVCLVVFFCLFFPGGGMCLVLFESLVGCSGGTEALVGFRGGNGE